MNLILGCRHDINIDEKRKKKKKEEEILGTEELNCCFENEMAFH